MSKFSKGQVVVLRSDRSVKGAIIDVMEGQPENQYQVFTTAGLQTCYESQLDAEDMQQRIEQVSAQRFHAGITASLIRNPTLSSLYSLNSAKIDFIPHQFRPVLKFIRSDRPRLLIADGVGVGKTIEAGLILKELQARRNLDSVLIICPKPLITERKWETEMERFGESFTPLDGAALRYCLNELNMEGEWPERYKRAIVPYSLFDEASVFGSQRRPGLLEIDPPKFDLVIVDEAHHIRNTATFAYRAVERFCATAEAVVLLTATPVQLGYDDLFVLLNLLRPDLIIDKKTFYDMAEPNEFINAAASLVRGFGAEWKEQAAQQLQMAADTSWGRRVLSDDPVFQRSERILAQSSVSPEERVQLIGDIESLHTFSTIISRTRRRDIGEFTLRKPFTVSVPFTPYQRELHDQILSLIHDILAQVHCTDNTKFMMTTLRRQTASCLFGLVPMLEEILYRHAYEIEETDLFDMPASIELQDLESVQTRIEKILDMAKHLPEEDPKLDAMLDVIENKQREPKKKIMIFSSFRHTLRYLEKKLSAAGFRIGVIHGGVPDEERREMRRRFHPQETSPELPEAIDVLLFSDVGCEGLDYQFCDCMINYDLPWNPMRVEQRIGRIDRNGQTSESVAIYNMITPGTVDADIYDRCLMRIGVFHSAVGDCERILGEITSEINRLVNNFSLSDEDRREKLQQMADNQIRSIREQEQLEENQRDLFGIRAPKTSFDTELKNATNFWLSSEMLQNMTLCYLSDRLGGEKEYLLGAKDLKKLRLSQEGRLALLNDFKQKKFPRNEVTKAWRKWLESGDQMLDVTFESKCWRENPNAVFLSFSHPLVQMAAEHLQSRGEIASALSAESVDVPPGQYPFAVYQWKLSGEREDLQIKPLSADAALNASLLDLLRAGEDAHLEVHTDPAFWDAVDKKHHAVWSDALANHRLDTNELIRHKEASLKTSHAARMATLREQLGKNDSRAYLQMMQGKLRIAQEDYDMHMALLEEARSRSDILFERLAYGLLEVENPT